MTELSPCGAFNVFKQTEPEAHCEESADLDRVQVARRGVFPTVWKRRSAVTQITADLPWDGCVRGCAQGTRGHWTVASYFRQESSLPVTMQQGWFDTGDIGTIDRHGFMAITDRAKDVIKSGGEWISSADLEGLAVGFDGVAEAAVIGVVASPLG